MKKVFIKVEIPVDIEQFSTGYFAWARVDVSGGDAKTPAKAIKIFRKRLRRLVAYLKKVHKS